MGGKETETPGNKFVGFCIYPLPGSPVFDRARSGRCRARQRLQRAPRKFLVPQRPSRGGGGHRVWVVFWFRGFFLASLHPVWKEGGLTRTSLDGAVERRRVRGWEGGLVVGGCRCCCSCIGVSPMDENSPLSPKANAFSIASLISVAAAAEQAAKGALEERSGGRSAPARPGCPPQKMHFSTVTRDMEGESRARPRTAAGTGPSAHRVSGCFRAARRGAARRQGRGESAERGLPAGPLGGGFAAPLPTRDTPVENKALPVSRWRLPTAPPLGPASPRRCWSILRERRLRAGQRRPGLGSRQLYSPCPARGPLRK